MSKTPSQLTKLALAALLIAIGLGVTSSPASAAETFTDYAAQTLAQRYAPIIMVQHQNEVCGAGEPFEPMPVDDVLDNGQIALRQVGEQNPVNRWGPTAGDIYNHGDGFFLDFPGVSLQPSCTYEKDFRRYFASSQPTIYAHVVKQDDKPNQIAVQYWFFWYYNNWVNTHEGDWEGIQVVFPASSAQDALNKSPSSVGYAQHEGGERQNWTSTELQKTGDHPVVYSSVGSHASYYESAIYLGRSASEGFGCDDTTGPSDKLTPNVVVLPQTASSADDKFAWLGFDGRWGEIHRGPYSGPTGPQDKPRWTNPIDWQDDLRPSSVTIPATDTRAGNAANTFCNVVEFGSQKLTALGLSPGAITLTLAAIIAIVVWLTRRTSWKPTDPSPIASKRRAGQTISTAFRMFKMAPRTFIGIGVAAVPIAAAAELIAWPLTRVWPADSLVDMATADGGTNLFLSLLFGTTTSAFLYTVITGATAIAMQSIEDGHPTSALLSLKRLARYWAPLTVAFITAALAIILLVSSFVFAVLAIFVVFAALFISQVATLEQSRSGWRTLRRSASLMRARLIPNVITFALIGGTVKLISGTTAILVLVAIRPPFLVLSTIIVAVDMLLAPLAAIAATYLYGNSLDAERKRLDAKQSS